MVYRGRDHLRIAAVNCAASPRIDLRPAASRLHAHDGVTGPNQFVRYGSAALCLWFNLDDCRTNLALGNSLRQIRRSVVLPDGNSLRCRTAVCLVRLC